MSSRWLATIWRGVVVTAILTGSAFLAVADLSGLPLECIDDHPLHFAAFFAATLLAVSAYPRRPLIHLLVALGLLAAVTELLQFAPGTGRQPDWRDFGFDILGINTALILVALWRVLRCCRPQSSSVSQVG